MAKKKIFLTDKKKKDLEGFEEILDLIGEKGPEIRDKDQQIEDYEIYDFLEKENLRLEKLDQFFSTHLPLSKTHSQTAKLIEKEMEEIGLLREEIIDELERDESYINEFLKDLYIKAFSS